ncbi:MAG: hypothetical protein KF782_34780 [Labilithrix sp.]|nr:hypothetical protein [Labilithrix sp.]
MNTIHVATGVVTETATGVEGGLDVGVTVTLPDGREVDGEVTLAPSDHASRPAYEAYGPSPDYWVSGGLLRALYAALDGDDLRDALEAIESAAAAATTVLVAA